MHENQLKLAYFDILNGYSSFQSKNYGLVFVKHQTQFDNLKLCHQYEVYYKKALINSIPSETEKIKELNLEGSWTEKEEKQVFDIECYIKTLYKTKSKLFQSALINQVKKQIMEEETKLLKLKLKKADLVGQTAESFGNKKINESHIFNSLYKDDKFSERLLSQNQFDELSDAEVIELSNIYSVALENINSQNIKKIALQSFFCNYFYLCNDDARMFYGVAVKDITFVQLELFSLGKYYKSIISNSKTDVPENIKIDPDRLVEYYEGNQNLEQMQGNSSDSGTEMFVGSKSDMERLGYTQSGGVDLVKLAQEKGNLDFADIVKAENRGK